MSCNFEKICSFPWIWDQYSTKEISCVRGYIFGKCKRGGDDIFIEKINVVALRISWIIIEWEVTCKHSVLKISAKEIYTGRT
jgi:hypothetical protein